jgi:hypothetical protein
MNQSLVGMDLSNMAQFSLVLKKTFEKVFCVACLLLLAFKSKNLKNFLSKYLLRKKLPCLKVHFISYYQ